MPPSTPFRVLVAGGGVAAGEAILALRADGGDDIAIDVVTPDARLVLRPDATVASFQARPVATYDLRLLAAQCGARLLEDRVAAVSPRAHRARLASGRTLEYDALLLALGARSRVGVPGATIFRDHRDIGRLGRLMGDLRSGRTQRFVVAVPRGTAWSLPAYEIALHAARLVADESLAAEVTVATPERAPLEILGEEASDAISSLLRADGVTVVTRRLPAAVERRAVRFTCGCRVPADSVVAVPTLAGRSVSGVRATPRGFVRTDSRGRVLGLPDVWAAGDMTVRPVKQGGLAAQDADAASADIVSVARRDAAARSGAPERVRVLRAAVLGGSRPLFVRRTLGASPDEATVGEDAPWWPPTKVVGRHITPWMASNPPVVPVPMEATA